MQRAKVKDSYCLLDFQHYATQSHRKMASYRPYRRIFFFYFSFFFLLLFNKVKPIHFALVSLFHRTFAEKRGEIYPIPWPMHCRKKKPEENIVEMHPWDQNDVCSTINS